MSTGFTQFFDQLKRIFCKEKKEGVPREEDSFPSMEELFCEPKDEVKEKAGLLSKEEKRKSVRFGEPFRGTKLSIPKNSLPHAEDDATLFLEAIDGIERPKRISGFTVEDILQKPLAENPPSVSEDVRTKTDPCEKKEEEKKEEKKERDREEESDARLFMDAVAGLEKKAIEEGKGEESALSNLPKMWNSVKEKKKKTRFVPREEEHETVLFMRAYENLSAKPSSKPKGLLSLGEQFPKLVENKRKEKKEKPKQRKRVVLPPERGAEIHEENDRETFLRAIEGTTAYGKSRYIAPEAPSLRTLSPSEENLADLMEGRYTFELFCRDEYFEGYISSLDPLTLDKLRAGHFSPEAHLDLHGFVVDQAYEALCTFIKNSWYKGLRTLLVVPGRGHNSIQGVGILRGRLQVWFTQEPLKRVVLAFCTAQPSDGGPGSVYVLLRKYKKRGRISWERFSDDLWS